MSGYGAGHQLKSRLLPGTKTVIPFIPAIFDLGGSNPTSYPFAIFPDLKYKSQNPDYFVKIDKTEYPVFWSGNYGVAWSNRA